MTPSDHIRRMFATFDANDVSSLVAEYRSYVDATPVYS
jgi:hypothetical protein